MRREIPKFDILHKECKEGTELNSRVVYRHDGTEEQIEAFEYPEDKDTGVTDLDNACCVKELATDTQILNGQDVMTR